MHLEQFPKHLEKNSNSLSEKTMRNKIVSKINVRNINLSKMCLIIVKTCVEPLILENENFWMY